jgi:hypothetical protein
MLRTFKNLALALTVCGLAAVGLANPAAGQIDPGEMGALEQRETELVARIAELDASIGELTTRVADLEIDSSVATVGVELVADSLERTVDSRREPARTRIQIAIAGFVGGDPRRSALIDEMEALQGSDEPTRRREMYGTVIDDAIATLADIDAELIELGDLIAVRRDELATVEAALVEVDDALATDKAEHALLTAELAEVRARITELRDLASRAVLTGLTSFDDPFRPAIAVKIDNVREALPQSGINQADIVYVEEVEGGLTRLAAIFHSTGVDVVGPVRSMRTSDIRLLPQFNSPLFANSGGNRGTLGALAQSSIVDIGANSVSEGYYRESARPRPHDLMTNTFNLWAIGSGMGGGTPSPIFTFRAPGSPPGPGSRPVSGVTIGYGSTSVTYDWDGSGWARTQDGAPTVDTDGVRVAPPNLVVQVTSYGVSSADALSPEARTIGSGTALLFTEGQVVQASWRRETIDDQTTYVDGEGNPLSILPGRTWVELPRPGRTTTR